MNIHSTISHIKNSLNNISANELFLILEYVLDIPRSQIINNIHGTTTNEEERRIASILLKRKNNIPIQYILGSAWFYKNKFLVNNNVLIPRPETEILVDLTLERLSQKLTIYKDINIIEIGSGSGCITISIIHEIIKKNKFTDKSMTFYLSDISEQAMEITKKNILNILDISKYTKKTDTYEIHKKRNPIRIKCRVCDIKPKELPPSHISLLISNPPYIPQKDLKKLQEEVKKEPKIALLGGDTGIEIYIKILNTFKSNKKLDYIFEIYEKTAPDLLKVIQDKKYLTEKNINLKKDLNHKNRFIEIF